MSNSLVFRAIGNPAFATIAPNMPTPAVSGRSDVYLDFPEARWGDSSREFVIGRSPDSDIVILGTDVRYQVSRRHAAIQVGTTGEPVLRYVLPQGPLSDDYPQEFGVWVCALQALSPTGWRVLDPDEPFSLAALIGGKFALGTVRFDSWSGEVQFNRAVRMNVEQQTDGSWLFKASDAQLRGPGPY